MSIVSSEEGEASEYPSSQRSTIESNPEAKQRVNVSSFQPGIFDRINGEREDDHLSKIHRSQEGNP